MAKAMVAFMQHCKRGFGIVIFKYLVLKVGNINQLRDKYVDIFGTKDEDTVEGYWTYDETFTGGVTPASSISLINYF